MRNRNRFNAVLILVVFSAILCIHSIFSVHGSLPVSLIESKENGEAREILNRCLKDMNLENEYSAEEISDFSVFYGDITENDTPELVMAIKFNNAVFVPVYCREGDKYTYKCCLGPFYDVESLEFRYMDNLSKNAVFLREKVNQSLGSFETNEFLRGYAFIDGTLTPIISIPTNIETYWNENFYSGGSKDKWERITQKSIVNWTGGDCPKIILTKEQNLSCADGKSTEKINSDEDFVTEDSRTVTETYTWSDKWKRFILGEKIYLPTGEKAAILEDMGNLPYSLAGFDSLKSRVLFENGDIEIVDNKDLNY